MFHISVETLNFSSCIIKSLQYLITRSTRQSIEKTKITKTILSSTNIFEKIQLKFHIFLSVGGQIVFKRTHPVATGKDKVRDHGSLKQLASTDYRHRLLSIFKIASSSKSYFSAYLVFYNDISLTCMCRTKLSYTFNYFIVIFTVAAHGLLHIALKSI